MSSNTALPKSTRGGKVKKYDIRCLKMRKPLPMIAFEVRAPIRHIAQACPSTFPSSRLRERLFSSVQKRLHASPQEKAPGETGADSGAEEASHPTLPPEHPQALLEVREQRQRLAAQGVLQKVDPPFQLFPPESGERARPRE